MISEFRIQNFKCFEEQNFNFGPLTVFCGLNCAGKSSVIQALLLLRQSYERFDLNVGGLFLNGEYVKIGTAKDALHEGAKTEKIAFNVQYDDMRFPSLGWQFEANSDSDVLDPIFQDIPKGKVDEFPFSSFEYLQAERIGPRTSFPVSDYIVGRNRRLGVSGEYCVCFLERYGTDAVKNSKMWHPLAQGVGLRFQVEAWLGEVSPGARIHSKSYRDMDSVNIEYSFAMEGELSGRRRATNVGFGVTYALPVITALLASNGGMLIIENPEAHLHPRAQVRMGQLIALAADAGCQIVVETHSDHVLNGLRMAAHGGLINPEIIKINYLKRDVLVEGGRPVVVDVKINPDGRFDRRPDGFFDEFSKSLDQLLDDPKPYGSKISF